MQSIQVTLTTTNVAQPVLPPEYAPGRCLPFSFLLIQNTGSNAMRLGDPTVSSTKGINILPSTVQPAFPFSYSGDLIDFWVCGTAADTLDIMLFE